MTDFTGIPRAFDVREAKRAREEEARKREQATSARNTSSATIGAGGRLDLDGGDLDIFNGGNTRVRDGGRFLIEGGGSMDITDDGQINVIGNGRSWPGSQLIRVVASLANRLAYNAWIGASYLVPGLYFTAEGESQGPYDPRVVSDGGVDVSAISAVKTLPYGPQVGDNIVSKGSFRADSWNVSIGAFAWDNVLNPGGGDGVAGVRGAGSFSVTPYDINMLLTNHTPGPDGIPDGPAVWIHGSLEEGILHLYGRAGVDITGPFTVDGLPVGGSVTSVAGKTGAVTLVKGDIGLGNVDNTTDLSKPVSTATATALSGKASTAVATTTTNGLMPSTDKAKLDAASPNPNANSLIYRDVWSRAQIADPVGPPDIANKSYVDAQIDGMKPGMHAPIALSGFTMAGMFSVKPPVNGVTEVVADVQVTRTGGTMSLTPSWTALGNIAPTQALKAGVGLRYFTAFSSATGAVYFYINFENGACGVRAVSGTVSVLNTAILSFSQSVLL